MITEAKHKLRWSAPRTRDGVSGVREAEIDPGRGVPGDWDAALRETWAERKARLAALRSEKPRPNP